MTTKYGDRISVRVRLLQEVNRLSQRQLRSRNGRLPQ
jgi:hypothetical protein